ncbi:phosphatidylinositol-3,4,5-trisphosphate 3-phosphatase [Pelomyxa schiedti]|nr:phosphatidylinositol-3,4,5-trisphosphate 3-phosphatase [Pelomyxa schiedti]
MAFYTALRTRFSGDKNRFDDGKYNLDLTYITDRVIAMSFPAEGVESTYRNFIDDVVGMMETHHKGHYMIFNLSGRDYDYAKFSYQVQYMWCSFPDHHAPPFWVLLKLVMDMYSWLAADPLNIVAVHCLAGKGRTGTVIASFFLLCGLFDQPDNALNFFARQRSVTQNGVSGPSQLRYVHYLSRLLHNKQTPKPDALKITQITLSCTPQFTLLMSAGIAPMLSIYQVSSTTPIFVSAPRECTGDSPIIFDVAAIVQGDILVVIDHVPYMGKPEQVCRFNFHTGYVEHGTLFLNKSAIDGAADDSRFPSRFSISVSFNLSPVLDLPDTVTNHVLETQLVTKIACFNIGDGSMCFFVDPAIGPASVQEKIAKARNTCGQTAGYVIAKSGWLKKQGSKWKNWKKRWFVLKGNSLMNFTSPKSPTPCGKILLDEIVSVVPICDLGIHIVVSLNTWRTTSWDVQAENAALMEEWLDAIQNARRFSLGLDASDQQCISFDNDSELQDLEQPETETQEASEPADLEWLLLPTSHNSDGTATSYNNLAFDVDADDIAAAIDAAVSNEVDGLDGLDIGSATTTTTSCSTTTSTSNTTTNHSPNNTQLASPSQETPQHSGLPRTQQTDWVIIDDYQTLPTKPPSSTE